MSAKPRPSRRRGILILFGRVDDRRCEARGGFFLRRIKAEGRRDPFSRLAPADFELLVNAHADCGIGGGDGRGREHDVYEDCDLGRAGNHDSGPNRPISDGSGLRRRLFAFQEIVQEL